MIKRHIGNRRMYCTVTHRYLTYPDLEQLIRDGQTPEVWNHERGKKPHDATAVAYAEIVLLRAKRGELDAQTLLSLIRPLAAATGPQMAER
jgi:polyhydroxyalkanoate synthesis regulator protein